MEIFYTLEKKENLSLALGFFDGVHLAHKKILTAASNYAKKFALKSAVITFKKSPGGYFDKQKNINIQTLEDRLSLIEKTGVDYVYVLDFEQFKTLSAKEYLENVLIDNFSPKFIVAGFNHTFGKNRLGDREFLINNENLGYKFIEIEKMRLNEGEISALVSSTNIKKFIEKAYIKEANKLLGYKFNVKGVVLRGLQLASCLGAPTANIEWPKDIVKPPYGVYFAYTELNGTLFPSVANFGIKPTAGEFKAPVLEVHILDFNEDIYGKNLRVFFEKGIRPEKKFSSLEELKLAIQMDLTSCRKLIEH